MIHLFIHSFTFTRSSPCHHQNLNVSAPRVLAGKLERYIPCTPAANAGNLSPCWLFFFLFFFSRFPCCWFGVVRSDESSAAWFGLVAFAFFFLFFQIVGRLQNRWGEISGVTSVPYLGKGKEGGNWLAVVSKNTRSCAALFVTTTNTALAVCLFVLWGFWCVCR